MSKEKKPVPEVYEREGIAVTDSRKVALYFGKEHFHVLRDIDSIVKTMIAVDSEQTASDQAASKIGFYQDYFIEQKKSGKTELYYVTRDGLMLLTMGYTGKKAMRLKLAYIARFNEMERELEARRLADYEQLRSEAYNAYLPGYHVTMDFAKRLVDYARETDDVDEREHRKIYASINGAVNRALGVKNGERKTKATPEQMTDMRRINRRIADVIERGIERGDYWGIILRDVIDSIDAYCKAVGLTDSKKLRGAA